MVSEKRPSLISGKTNEGQLDPSQMQTCEIIDDFRYLKQLGG